MGLTERRMETKATLNDIIAEAETLIVRCKNALASIDTMVDEESAQKWDAEIGERIEDGFKHIELF